MLSFTTKIIRLSLLADGTVITAFLSVILADWLFFSLLFPYWEGEVANTARGLLGALVLMFVSIRIPSFLYEYLRRRDEQKEQKEIVEMKTIKKFERYERYIWYLFVVLSIWTLLTFLLGLIKL